MNYEWIKNLLFKAPIILKNTICFESNPDLADNTYCVFNELVKRGINKRYHFVWILNDADADINKYPVIDNVRYIPLKNKNGSFNVKALIALATSKYFIPSHLMISKFNKNQKYVLLTHGAAIKEVSTRYALPVHNNDTKILSLSDYQAKVDTLDYLCNVDKFVSLGHPRNDLLFVKRNLTKLISQTSFRKIIYWMPTYRQHKSVNAVYSNISLPIIYNERIAAVINDCAIKNNVFIVLKPHPAQDLTKIKEYHLKNIMIINDRYFAEHSITNYEFLGNCDALITDYSSVYYDYLLCDKPIGLCWDDFDVFEKKEGFVIDPNFIMKGGEKIYTSDDFCAFIERIATGEDLLKKERNEIRDLCHQHIDSGSTKRVADYLEENYL